MTDQYLIARLRERDQDIIKELERRNLNKGVKADMIRDGFRRELFKPQESLRSHETNSEQQKEPDTQKDSEPHINNDKI